MLSGMTLFTSTSHLNLELRQVTYSVKNNDLIWENRTGFFGWYVANFYLISYLTWPTFGSPVGRISAMNVNFNGF